jgi:hypothetical protein
MSRALMLTFAAAATITVGSIASSTSYAHGGGHGGGGGHSGGGHVSAGGHGSHASNGGHGRSAHNGGHDHGGRVARNGDRHGHPEHTGRWAGHGHGRWIFRDGRWIVLDPVDSDAPDVAPVSDASPDPTDNQVRDGQCLVSVYWDADFKGEQWNTVQNQTYVGNHWNDQISSIRIVSGTWRFYWDANFGGEMLELKPGEYRYVGNHWNDQISSFRCVRADAAANQ